MLPNNLQPLQDPFTPMLPESSQKFDFSSLDRMTEQPQMVGGGVSADQDPLVNLIKRGPDPMSKLTPISFNWDRSGIDRYINSPYFKDLGFNPNRDNESRYGYAQTWGNTLNNAIKGMFSLGYTGFMDGWKGWGRAYDSIKDWDFSGLMGDEESQLALNKAQTDVMNKYAIYSTPESEDTFFNRKTLGNFLQQSGFTLGVLAQTGVELAVTKAIEGMLFVPTGGATGAVAAGTTAKSLGNLARLGETLKNVFTKTKATKALVEMGNTTLEGTRLADKIWNTTSRILPLVGEVRDINLALKAGVRPNTWAGVKTLGSIGIGGIKRTLSEANLVFSEARMEAAGTYADMRDKMYWEYYDKYGEAPTGDRLNDIESTARKAAQDNFNTNSLVIGVSNRIMFDNMFKSFKLGKFLREEEGAAARILNVTGKLKDGTVGTRAFQKGMMGTPGQFGAIASQFGRKQALKELGKSVLRHGAKWEITEGLQENIQDISNDYFSDYYYDLYSSKYDPSITPDKQKSWDLAIDNQMSMQGIKTFMSGALTGFITSGPTKLVERGGKRLFSSKEERDRANNAVKEHVTKLNEFYTNTASSFLSPIIRNFKVQADAAGLMQTAMENDDRYSFENFKEDAISELVFNSMQMGTHEALLSHLEHISKNMTKEEFEQAFQGFDFTDENKKTAQDYVGKVANSIKSYIDISEKYHAKYDKIYNPRFFQPGTREREEAEIAKKAVDNAIHIIASNEWKHKKALERMTGIYSNISANRSLGNSLATAFNTLGTEQYTKQKIESLNEEIKSLESLDKLDPISKDRLKTKKEQLSILTNWMESKDELLNEAKVDKSYKAFADYINSKNKEEGSTAVVNKNDTENTFMQLADYTRLNRKAQQHVEAINILTNPKVYTEFLKRHQIAATKIAFENAFDAINTAEPGFVIKNKGTYDRINELASKKDRTEEENRELFSSITKLKELLDEYSDKDVQDHIDLINKILETEKFKNMHSNLAEVWDELNKELAQIEQEKGKESEEYKELEAKRDMFFDTAITKTINDDLLQGVDFFEKKKETKSQTKIGKIPNTDYEIKEDGIYYQDKKLEVEENQTVQQAIEEDIKKRKQEELDSVDISKGGKLPIEGYDEFYKNVNNKYNQQLQEVKNFFEKSDTTEQQGEQTESDPKKKQDLIDRISKADKNTLDRIILDELHKNPLAEDADVKKAIENRTKELQIEQDEINEGPDEDVIYDDAGKIDKNRREQKNDAAKSDTINSTTGLQTLNAKTSEIDPDEAKVRYYGALDTLRKMIGNSAEFQTAEVEKGRFGVFLKWVNPTEMFIEYVDGKPQLNSFARQVLQKDTLDRIDGGTYPLFDREKDGKIEYGFTSSSIMVLVDSKGEPYLFNQDGKLDSNGKLVYTVSRSVGYDKEQGRYFAIWPSDGSNQIQTPKELAAKQMVGKVHTSAQLSALEAQIDAQQQKEFKRIYELRKSFRDDKKKVILLPITQITEGQVEYLKEPQVIKNLEIKDIQFKIGSPATGTRNGAVYFVNPVTKELEFVVRPAITTEQARLIEHLIFEDHDIPVDEVLDFLKAMVYTRNHSIWFKIVEKDGKVRIVPQTYDKTTGKMVDVVNSKASRDTFVATLKNKGLNISKENLNKNFTNYKLVDGKIESENIPYNQFVSEHHLTFLKQLDPEPRNAYIKFNVPVPFEAEGDILNPNVSSEDSQDKTDSDDIKAKKADIERRRQEELKYNFGNSIELISSGRIPVIERQSIYSEKYPKGTKLANYDAAKKLVDDFKEINAKYDAELAALEKSNNLQLSDSEKSIIKEFRDRTGIKDDTVSDNDLLQNLAEQSFNITGGKRNTNAGNTDLYKNTIEQVGSKELVDLARKKFPENVLLKEDKKQEPVSKKSSIEEGNLLLKRKSIDNKATPEQIKAAKEWWEQSDLKDVISLEEMMDIVNSNAVAQWTEHAIRLFNGANYTDLYHEAWHGFSQLFLTKDDKISLYDETKKLKGSFINYEGKTINFADASYFEIEEFLGEDFRKYVLSNGKLINNKRVKRNTIFRRILNFLRRLFTGVTQTDWITDNGNVTHIKEMYDKLRTNNFKEYSPSVFNMMFGKLNKSITGLSNAESKLVADSIDFIITDTFDQINELRRSQNQPIANITSLFTNIPFKNWLFDTTRKRFEEKIATATPYQAEVLRRALADFDGTLRYYADKSDFLRTFEIESEESAEGDDSDQTKPGARDSLGDKSGNDRSIDEQMPHEVKYLLSTLTLKNSDGTDKLNALGFPQAVPFNRVKTRLIKMLAGMADESDMYNAIVAASSEYPELVQLAQRLGDPSDYEGNMAKFNLWMKFRQPFKNPIVPIVEQLAELDKDNNIIVKLSRAKPDIDKVQAEFSSNFVYALPEDNPYILIKDGQNVLNVNKLTKEFGEPYLDRSVPDVTFWRFNKKTNVDDFLNALGIKFDNRDEIKKEVEKFGEKTDATMTRILQALVNLSNNDVDITDPLSQLKTPIKSINFAGEQGNVDKLLAIQAQHSDDYANFSVINPAGDPEFEHSMPNMITTQFTKLNDYKKFPTLQDVLSDPTMSLFDISKNPIMKGSKFLERMFNPDGTRVLKENGEPVRVEVANISGVKLIGLETGSEGLKTGSLNKYAKFMQDFNGFLGYGFPGMLQHASKNTYFSVKLDDASNGDKNLYYPIRSFFADRLYDYEYLKNLLIGELTTIGWLNEKGTGKGKNIQGYKDRAKDFRIMDLLLSDELKSIFKDFVKEGVPENINEFVDSHKDALKNSFNVFFRAYVKQNRSLINPSHISSYLLNGVKSEYKKANYTAVKDNEGFIDILNRAYTFNQFVHSVELLRTVYGDPAMYNLVKDELHKRIGAAAAFKNTTSQSRGAIKFINDSGRLVAKHMGIAPKVYDGTFDVRIYKDPKIKSDLHDDYVKVATEHFMRLHNISRKEAEKMAKNELDAYEDMKEPDAHGVMTLDSWVIIQQLIGNWDESMQSIYEKIAQGQEITNSEYRKFFGVKKLQHFGPLASNKDYDGYLYAPAFHKFAVMPLIPSMIKGTALERINEDMIRSGHDYYTFESGSKVANVGEPISFFKNDDYHKRDPNVQSENNQFAVNRIFTEFLGEQVEMSPEWKNKVIFSTQSRKLITAGIYQGGVPVDYAGKEEQWNTLSEKEKRIASPLHSLAQNYIDDIENLSALLKEKLLKDIGANSEDYTIENYEKVVKILHKEFKRRDLPDDIIDFVDVVEGGKLKNQLDISPYAQRMEAIIQAIINNRLIRQKVNGEQLVQVPSTGLNQIGFRNATKEEQRQYGSDLKFYQPGKGKNGVTSAMQVKVALTGDYLHLLNLRHKDGEFIRIELNKVDQARLDELNAIKWTTMPQKRAIDAEIHSITSKYAQQSRNRLNEMIKDEKFLDDNRHLLTMVGERIPVQGLNSMEFMEISEFLPAEAGNLIVLPTEIVAKSGGDYDVDKLNIRKPSFKTSYKRNLSNSKLREISKKYPNLDFSRDNINIILDATKDTEETYKIEGDDQKILDIINNETSEISGVELSKGKIQNAENNLIYSTRELLEHPANFMQLITPNSNKDLKALAVELAKRNISYNPKINIVTGKENSRVSPTILISPIYNLYQFEANIEGKNALAISAIDNTFNVLLNNAGAYLNKEYIHYTSSGKPIEKTVFLPFKHNKTKDGNVSMSHNYDADGKHRIGRVIEQLMNGHVDVEKDPWIFDINAGETSISTVIYMVEAGVPIRDIAYFMTQPTIQHYTNALREKKNLYDKIKNPQRHIAFSRKIQVEQFNRILGTNFKQLDQVLKHMLEVKKKVDIDKLFSEGLNSIEHSKEEEAVMLLQYIDMEDIADKITSAKTALNFDTRTSAGAIMTLDKQQKFDEVVANKLFPENIIIKIRDESILKAFKIQDLTMALQEQLLPLRNNPVVNQYIINKKKDLPPSSRAEKFERFAYTFKNDLFQRIFQKALRDANVDTSTWFKGDNSIAKQLKRIQDKYPELTREFSVLRALQPDVQTHNRKGEAIPIEDQIQNIKLTIPNSDSDLTTIYRDQFYQLIDDSIKKIADEKENRELTQFFKKLAIFGFLQSGLNKSHLSFNEVIPNDLIAKVLREPVQRATIAMTNPEQLNEFYRRFKEQNQAIFWYTDEDGNTLAPKNPTPYRGKDYIYNRERIVKEPVQIENPLIKAGVQNTSKEIKGINIRTDKDNPNSLSNRLTNPNWYAKDLMDVESAYKANQSKKKAPHLNAEDALKYDMNLMYQLQVQKFRKNPELIDEINSEGGLEFIKKSSHIVGVKNSRWEGVGIESNFIKVLAKSYETVAKELGKFKDNQSQPGQQPTQPKQDSITPFKETTVTIKKDEKSNWTLTVQEDGTVINANNSKPLDEQKDKRLINKARLKSKFYNYKTIEASNGVKYAVTDESRVFTLAQTTMGNEISKSAGVYKELIEKAGDFIKESKTEPIVEQFADKNKRLKIQYPKNIEFETVIGGIPSSELIKASNLSNDDIIPFMNGENYRDTIFKMFGEAAARYVNDTDSEISRSEGEWLKSLGDNLSNNFITDYLESEAGEGKTIQEFAQFLLDKNEKIIDTAQLSLFDSELNEHVNTEILLKNEFDKLSSEEKNKIGSIKNLIDQYESIPFEMDVKDFMEQLKCNL